MTNIYATFREHNRKKKKQKNNDLNLKNVGGQLSLNRILECGYKRKRCNIKRLITLE